jgi:hypothetical protein
MTMIVVVALERDQQDLTDAFMAHRKHWVEGARWRRASVGTNSRPCGHGER